jgi:hypothetical protein
MLAEDCWDGFFAVEERDGMGDASATATLHTPSEASTTAMSLLFISACPGCQHDRMGFQSL